MDDQQAAINRNQAIVASDQSAKALVAMVAASAITDTGELAYGELLRAMRKLAKSCCGVLPQGVALAWDDAQKQMTLAGKAGLSAPDELLVSLKRLCAVLRTTWHVSQNDEQKTIRVFQPAADVAEITPIEWTDEDDEQRTTTTDDSGEALGFTDGEGGQD